MLLFWSGSEIREERTSGSLVLRGGGGGDVNWKPEKIALRGIIGHLPFRATCLCKIRCKVDDIYDSISHIVMQCQVLLVYILHITFLAFMFQYIDYITFARYLMSRPNLLYLLRRNGCIGIWCCLGSTHRSDSWRSVVNTVTSKQNLKDV